jgi:hypothetical protein
MDFCRRAMRKILLASSLIVSGCAPLLEYEHLSDPRIDNDGIDLICVGGEGGDRVTVSTGVCKNLHGGEYVKVNVRVSG